MPFELPNQAPRSTPFERVGGREVIRRIVEDFYARIEQDAALREVFPADLASGIERQKLFMEQWLGGAPLYSMTVGQPMLRRRHFPFVIGPEHAERWLLHMRAAMHSAGVDDATTAEIMQRLEPLAMHMINDRDDVPRDPLPPGM